MVDWEMDIHISVAQLSAALKEKNHATGLYLIKGKKDLKNLFSWIENFQPALIGFSFTQISFPHMVEIARKIKRRYPSIFLIAGGIHCILSPQETIKRGVFDAVCIGEGEAALAALADSLKKGNVDHRIKNLWFKKGRRIIKNQRETPQNLDTLPFPDYDLFYESDANLSNWHPSQALRRRGYFLMSRGCPFNCSYCSNHALKEQYGAGYFRIISPAVGIKLLKTAIAKYHFQEIWFYDDTFTINKQWFFQFLKLYKAQIGLPFGCHLRIGTFDKGMVRELVSSGCTHVFFGLESGDEELRTQVLNRYISDQAIQEQVALLKAAKIWVGSYNMMGLPHETVSSFKKTILLNAKINVDYPIFFIFFPYKGTKLYYFCKRNQLFRKGIKKDFVLKNDTVLKLPDFTRKDLLYLHRQAEFLVDLAKARRGWLSRIYHRLLFQLAFMPPSAKHFAMAQLLVILLIGMKSLKSRLSL